MTADLTKLFILIRIMLLIPDDILPGLVPVESQFFCHFGTDPFCGNSIPAHQHPAVPADRFNGIHDGFIRRIGIAFKAVKLDDLKIIHIKPVVIANQAVFLEVEIQGIAPLL